MEIALKATGLNSAIVTLQNQKRLDQKKSDVSSNASVIWEEPILAHTLIFCFCFSYRILAQCIRFFLMKYLALGNLALSMEVMYQSIKVEFSDMSTWGGNVLESYRTILNAYFTVFKFLNIAQSFFMW